jgi:hypothetical protein
MKQDNKKALMMLGGVVVLAGLLWLTSRSASTTPGGMTPTPTPSAKGSAKPVVKSSPAPVVAMPQSYADALKTYENRRIQFDQYCQAIPTSLVFKNGVTLMLDNRSGDARTVKVGPTAYYLSGYGWKIVTLSVPSSTLPATLAIDCGSARNVSKILLQK